MQNAKMRKYPTWNTLTATGKISVCPNNESPLFLQRENGNDSNSVIFEPVLWIYMLDAYFEIAPSGPFY